MNKVMKVPEESWKFEAPFIIGGFDSRLLGLLRGEGHTYVFKQFTAGFFSNTDWDFNAKISIFYRKITNGDGSKSHD